MKGIIAICLKEMVIEKYGLEMWEKCLLNSGATSDVSFDAMDKVHFDTTCAIENARPPRFEYQWNNSKTLLVTYKSERDLIDFFMGLVRGVGKHYNEALLVKKIDSKNIEIVFD